MYALELWPLWVPVLVGAALSIAVRRPWVMRATGVAWLAGAAVVLT